MAHHHAFGHACRPRCVNHVGSAFWLRVVCNVTLLVGLGNMVDGRLVDNDADGGFMEDVLPSLGRQVGVDGYVGTTGTHDGECSNEEGAAGLGVYAYKRACAYTL